MKGKYKSVIAALLVAVVAAVADESCPSDWWAREKLLVHEDCHKFYMCTYGKPVEMTCCCDLYFNVESGQCDWQYNVDCGDRNSPGDALTIEVETDPTATDLTTADSTTPAPTTTEPTTSESTTPEPSTTDNVTSEPTTTEPTTPEPTITEPTNPEPTTPTITEPTTPEPPTPTTTEATTPEPPTPTTSEPTTLEPPTPTTTELTTPESQTPTTTEPTTPEPPTPTTTETTTPEPATPTTTEPTTPEPPTPTTMEPTTLEPANTEPTTPEPSAAKPTTPAPGFLENGCPVDPHIHWLLPVEGDCNGFYYCVWGELVLRACPPTLHFNTELQVCDWPANAGCNSSVPTTQPTTPEPNVTTPTTPTPNTTAKPTTPTSAFLENGCPTNPHIHWLLPVEGDCNGFYYCVWGELVLRACPPALHFNKELQVCDWPANAGCNSSVPTTTKPTTPEPTTTELTTMEPTTPEPTTTEPTTTRPTTPEPTTTEPTTTKPTTPEPTTAKPTTPAPGFLENGCPVDPHIHWLLPVDGDCNGFYYCVWGELVLRACPPTLHFNKNLQVCDWPRDAGCNSSVPTTTKPTTPEPNATTPTTPKDNTVKPTPPSSGFLENGCPTNPHIHWLLPVEGDCNGFYYCVWGELVLRACPPTLHFNKELQVCDWPANAGCNSSVPSTTKPTTPEPTTTELTTTEPTTPEPTTTEPTTTKPTTPEPTTIEPTTTQPTTPEPTTAKPTTPAPGFLENGCPVDPHIHWLLPVEGDCNGFYYCVWGELVLRACPPTLHFNKNLQVCDWPTEAGCITSLNKHNMGQYSKLFATELFRGITNSRI
ncbi:mucin-2-like isoform X2 [Cydia pomonella]|uniref:mucin-2-like isoform X2 n=1 Tax=Cydia pomonella TaxID=82600 RepID=UPI002ADE5520|nr:mucin-2-like isoform X2 [Cydia pomonella]